MSQNEVHTYPLIHYILLLVSAAQSIRPKINAQNHLPKVMRPKPSALKPYTQSIGPNHTPKTYAQNTRPKNTPKTRAQNTRPKLTPKTHAQSLRPKHTLKNIRTKYLLKVSRSPDEIRAGITLVFFLLLHGCYEGFPL